MSGAIIMAAEAELGVMGIGLSKRAQKRMEKKKRRLKEAEVGFWLHKKVDHQNVGPES